MYIVKNGMVINKKENKNLYLNYQSGLQSKSQNNRQIDNTIFWVMIIKSYK